MCRKESQAAQPGEAELGTTRTSRRPEHPIENLPLYGAGSTGSCGIRSEGWPGEQVSFVTVGMAVEHSIAYPHLSPIRKQVMVSL